MSQHSCGRVVTLLLIVVSSAQVSADQPEAVVADQPEAVVADQSEAVVADQPETLSPEATQFIKGMALLLLPTTYSDDDDWGGQRKIQSGLNVRVDGLKVRTSRRWKDVNQGTWKRVDASLVDPQNHFRLSIQLLPRVEKGVPRYRVHAAMRLRATGRQQQWALGAKLYSISADVVADVEFNADLHFQTQVTAKDKGGKLRVLPFIEQADAKLVGFSLRRVSHVKGGPVREFGHVIESLIRRAVRKKGEKLAAKINGKVQKKPERFEIPAGILVIFGESAEDIRKAEESATSEE